MAIYCVKDLLDCLHETVRHGCEYVELHTDSDTISLKGLIDEHTEAECVTVHSCKYGEATDGDSDDENCYELQFTYDEIATIASALANMPSIYKNAISDEAYDPREREAFCTMSEKMFSLKSKIEEAFK